MHETISFKNSSVSSVKFQFKFGLKLRQIQSKAVRVNNGFILVFPVERYAFLIGFGKKVDTGGNQLYP